MGLASRTVDNLLATLGLKVHKCGLLCGLKYINEWDLLWAIWSPLERSLSVLLYGICSAEMEAAGVSSGIQDTGPQGKDLIGRGGVGLAPKDSSGMILESLHPKRVYHEKGLWYEPTGGF